MSWRIRAHYIYCDGPKEGASDEMRQKIADVRQVARTRQWCKEVHVLRKRRRASLEDGFAYSLEVRGGC